MNKFWYSNQLAYISKIKTCFSLMIMLMQLFGSGESYFGLRSKYT